MLVADKSPVAGGQFYLVDGYGVLAGLAAVDHGAAFDIPMVPADPSIAVNGDGGGSAGTLPRRVRAGWRSPVAKRVSGSGRVMLRPPVEGNATNQPDRDQPDPGEAVLPPHSVEPRERERERESERNTDRARQRHRLIETDTEGDRDTQRRDLHTEREIKRVRDTK